MAVPAANILDYLADSRIVRPGTGLAMSRRARGREAMRIDKRMLVRVALCTAALVIPFAGLALLLYAFVRKARVLARKERLFARWATPSVVSMHALGQKRAVALDLNGLAASPTK
jgi:hypothetical protein